jgi:ferredoxin
MPEKYHINPTPVPPRLPRIGKHGIVDWREDCARCHNCVKKACVYDRHRQETEYIRNLKDVDSLFFDCMGCFSCVQDCTKGLLSLTINPVYEQLGNSYWTPDIILSTWLQAETGKVPVSGAGYKGRFSGPGFDAMWMICLKLSVHAMGSTAANISAPVDLGESRQFIFLTEKND